LLNKTKADSYNKSLEQEDAYLDKIFTVKSMRVNWHGRASYMHVFFVNKDILMLEEANDNIKLQKIMFASVSHEFRTPLNAIINSFILAENSFDELMPMVSNLLKLSKDQ
jgi:signal transduction histidine kinase